MIIAIHRGGENGEILRDDTAIGTVQPDDVIEFSPLVHDDGPELPPNVEVIHPAPGFQSDRGERASFVTSDGSGWEFEPPLTRVGP